MERHSLRLPRRSALCGNARLHAEGYRENLGFKHRQHGYFVRQSVLSRSRTRLLRSYLSPFWRRELDIEDIDVVKRCLEAAGVESAGFDDFVNGEGKQMHDHILRIASMPGCTACPPTFWKKVFSLARAPALFRWVLTGKRGAAPDVCNEVVS